MEFPILMIIGPHRHAADERQLLVIEESIFLSAKSRAGQVGGCEIVPGRRVATEGSPLDTCRDAPLDDDDAWPLEKQQIAREGRILQRHKRMGIPDRE